MAAPNLGINTNARDVTFTFQDSCNCWGRARQPAAQVYVYVHNDGRVVPTKERKVYDDRTQMRIRENMKTTIQRASKNAEIEDGQRVIRRVERHSGVNLGDSTKRMTLEDAQKIDEATRRVLASPLKHAFASSEEESSEDVDVDAAERAFKPIARRADRLPSSEEESGVEKSGVKV